MADHAARIQQLEAALAEANEQLTATAEVLRVIASSSSALQPVLDAIVASAGRLTEASGSAIWRVEGDTLRFAASIGRRSPDQLRLSQSQVRPVDRSSPIGQAVLEG